MGFISTGDGDCLHTVQQPRPDEREDELIKMWKSTSESPPVRHLTSHSKQPSLEYVGLVLCRFHT